MEDFRSIYRTIVHRPEFQEIFRTYSPNNKVLVDTELIDFLKKEQYETEGCETTALEIILKYEPIEEGMRSLGIWFLVLIYCASACDCVYIFEYSSDYADWTF